MPISPDKTSPVSVSSSVPSCVAVYGHNKCSSSTAPCAVRLVRELLSGGIDVEFEEELYHRLLSDDVFTAELQQQVSVFSQFPQRSTMVISLGGDGTFLRTVEKLGRSPLPILGINTGRLGFLADVSADDIETAVSQIVSGNYEVGQRSLIAFQAPGKSSRLYPYALNEVAVLKHDNSSLIEVETRVDGRLLTTYVADGLVVSTPTGSTGYALSAGGPILSPDSSTLCLVPVAPHSLTMRPVVLSDDVVLRLRVKSRTGHFLVALDGRSCSMEAGQEIELRKADYSVPVVRMRGSDFFHTLQCKMMWGLDQRN